jgi:3-dehydroquinate synthetase
MAGETEIAAGMGLIGREDRRRIINLLAAAGLPRHAPGIDPGAARRALAFDKKNSGGTPAFVLPSAIGATTFRRDVPETLIRRALKNITTR